MLLIHCVAGIIEVAYVGHAASTMFCDIIGSLIMIIYAKSVTKDERIVMASCFETFEPGVIPRGILFSFGIC